MPRPGLGDSGAGPAAEISLGPNQEAPPSWSIFCCRSLGLLGGLPQGSLLVRGHAHLWQDSKDLGSSCLHSAPLLSALLSQNVG